jgi:hypothetical protein
MTECSALGWPVAMIAITGMLVVGFGFWVIFR